MRMPLRRRLVRLRDWKCPAFLPVLLTAALLFTGFRAVFNAHLRPAIETMAVSSAKNRISETVSRAVADCIAEQQLSYQDFITMETDASGQITCLTSNLSAASLLRLEIVGYITEELDALRQESFGIPVGSSPAGCSCPERAHPSGWICCPSATWTPNSASALRKRVSIRPCIRYFWTCP